MFVTFVVDRVFETFDLSIHFGYALSKMDCPTTPEETLKCSKYPYRKVVGQLMYGMVHTIVITIIA